MMTLCNNYALFIIHHSVSCFKFNGGSGYYLFFFSSDHILFGFRSGILSFISVRRAGLQYCFHGCLSTLYPGLQELQWWGRTWRACLTKKICCNFIKMVLTICRTTQIVDWYLGTDFHIAGMIDNSNFPKIVAQWHSAWYNNRSTPYNLILT